MPKWIAVLLVGCLLVSVNVYLFRRVQSLEQKLDLAEQRTQQLRNSTQGDLNTLTYSVNANDADLRRKLDWRFGQVEGKAGQIEEKIHKIDVLVGHVSGLEYWSSLGSLRMVKLYFEEGADVNAKSENGYTALHAAAENGHTEVVRLLLTHGADKAAQLDSGETPLALARAGKHEQVVRLLEGK